MSTNNQKMNLKIALVTIALLVLAFLFPDNIFSFEDKYWLSGAIVFFLLVTLYILKRISGSLNVSQSKFNAVYFGSMGLKMLLALIYVIIYLKVSTLSNKFAVIFMLCVYFIYTGFEIQFILSKLRTNSEK